MLMFTLAELRHAELVTFPENFEKAWLEHTGKQWVGGRFKGLFWFIYEYGSDPDCLALATKIVEATKR
jgi:hypothetical protein